MHLPIRLIHQLIGFRTVSPIPTTFLLRLTAATCPDLPFALHFSQSLQKNQTPQIVPKLSKLEHFRRENQHDLDTFCLPRALMLRHLLHTRNRS